MNSLGPILIALLGDGHVTRWNSAAERVFGLDAATAQGKAVRHLRIPWDRGAVLGAVAECRATGRPVHVQSLPLGKVRGDKGRLDLWVNAFPNARADPSCIYILGTEVGTRSPAAKDARESEATFQAIVEGAAEGILIADLPSRGFVYANPAICSLLGYSEEELLAMCVADIHPRSAIGPVTKVFEAQARGELTLAGDVPCLRKDGTIIYADIKTANVALYNRQLNVGFFTDTTQRREAQTRCVEKLRSANHEIARECGQKEQLLASLASILVALAKDDTITQWNRTAEETFGLREASVRGQPLRQVNVSWDLSPILVALTQCRGTGATVRVDNIKYRRLDGSNGVLGLTVSPFGDSHPEVTGVLLHAADVTERRDLELQLRQSQKLESIGQLAAGIAHEINTPTQYVGDNLAFLKRAFGALLAAVSGCDALLKAARQGHVEPEAVDQTEAAWNEAKLDFLAAEVPLALGQCFDGLGRVASIVSAMKEFAHPSNGERHPLDLRHAIETTLTVARNEWKYVADVVTDFDQTLPPVPCLRDGLNQVILNLIINAAHAISDVTDGGAKGKGRITVTTRRAGEWAEIRVSDNGAGIPAKIRGRIFDPFFTTKEVGKGTGQGLAIAHSVIVDKHQGQITFESEEGKGTTFSIWLPLTSSTCRETEGAA